MGVRGGIIGDRGGVTVLMMNGMVFSRFGWRMPLAFMMPMKRDVRMGEGLVWEGQSRKRTRRVRIPLSQVDAEVAGCSVAPVSGLILVVVWLVRRMARFWVAASLVSLEMMSLMMGHFRLVAHWVGLGVCFVGGWGGFLGGRGFGNARVIRVEIESIIIRLVPWGGKLGVGWVRRTRRWGRVGVVNLWNFFSSSFVEWDVGVEDFEVGLGFCALDRISLNLGPASSYEASVIG